MTYKAQIVTVFDISGQSWWWSVTQPDRLGYVVEGWAFTEKAAEQKLRAALVALGAEDARVWRDTSSASD